MGIKWDNFDVKGIDVSKYNGVIDWNKVRSSGCTFAIIRAGYGRTTDPLFLQNWTNAKGKVVRIAYWYMDYYSGYSGKVQAEYLYNLIKNDYDVPFVFLDIESGGSDYSPNIYSVWAKAQTIARDFFARMKELRGLSFKAKNPFMRLFKPNNLKRFLQVVNIREDGIYCSLSMTGQFDSDLKEKPLWVAWYDEMMTSDNVPNSAVRTGESVIQACREYYGWKGKILLWQYASDGDVDDNGSSDGITVFGTQLKEMDLNGWLGTEQEGLIYTGGSIVNPPTPTPIPEITLYYPLPEGIRISQAFGVNPQWYPSSKGHNGVDWACGVGTPIYAMDNGKVIRADALQGKTGYGRHIRIQHETGVSIYGHLSKMFVGVGENVTVGQIIGLSGGAITDPACGNSTGAHLHGEFRLDGIENPVPGGYTYNAIDILPLLLSYPEDSTIVPLYSVRVTATQLNVRTSPIINSTNIIKTVSKGSVFPIYEESNGFGRISKVHNEWISISTAFTVRTDSNVTRWIVTASLGLKIRQLPSLTASQIGSLKYNETFNVSQIVNGNWGKLADREGYVCIDYAKQV